MPYAVGDYYERIEDYDLAYQAQSEQDLPFWRSLVERYAPERILELACGSGRIGLDLLRLPLNFKMEGLDLSEGMLKAYQRKLKQESAETQQRVTLHQEDMTAFDLPNKGHFDLIFLPFNSIAHLHEIEEQMGAFKNAYEHLRSGGRFVVDIQLPDLDYLSDALNRPSHVYLEDEIEDPDGEFTMLNYSIRKYESIEQHQRMTWIHERFSQTSGENERYLTRLDMHMFFPRELQLLFLASSFKIENIYGGYNFEPYGNGTRQLVIGHK